jgi:hypothetical protein
LFLQEQTKEIIIKKERIRQLVLALALDGSRSTLQGCLEAATLIPCTILLQSQEEH